MREAVIGRLGGIELRVTAAAAVGLGLLWAALVAGLTLLRLPIAQAVAGGLAGALLHFLNALVHHLSHAAAARATGYPMRAVRFGRMLVLATSVYPEHEPQLPAQLHIRRALGGPIGSLLWSLAFGGVALALRGSGGLPYFLALFAALDGFLIFFLGVLLPLGFTDMSTILRWWGQRE